MEQNNQAITAVGTEQEIEIDLCELMNLIWRNIFIIIESGLCAGAILFLVCTLLIPKTYISTTEVYVLHQQSNPDTITYSDLQTGSYLTDDYKELITSLPVLEKVIAKLDLDITPEAFEKKITVTSPDDTRIICIAAEDEDPYMAHQTADMLRVAAAEQIARVMDIEAVQTVQEASYPTAKSGPARMKYAVIGCVLGVIFSVGILIIRQLLDDTIKTEEDVEASLGLFVLGSVPQIQKEAGKKYRKSSKRWQHGKN